MTVKHYLVEGRSRWAWQVMNRHGSWRTGITRTSIGAKYQAFKWARDKSLPDEYAI
jgi:hypothetical protein